MQQLRPLNATGSDNEYLYPNLLRFCYVFAVFLALPVSLGLPVISRRHLSFSFRG
jgi:hypothetical protein